jgi:hypothetical protein
MQSWAQCPGDQTRRTPHNTCSYVASGGEFNVSLPSGCSALLHYTVTGASSGSGWSNLNGFVFNKGTSLVEWTGTDSCGHIPACSLQVTVIDTPMVAHCPADESRSTTNHSCYYIASGGEFDATFSFPPVAQTYTISGATSGSGSATSLSGFIFNQGLSFIEWTGTDSCGNIADCSMNVTVTDTGFDAHCPADESRSTTNHSCYYVTSGGEFDVTFSFPPVSQTYTISGATSGSGSATSLSGFIFNQGVSFIEWTGTDSCGNIANCSMNVTVTDTGFDAHCPGDQIRSTGNHPGYYIASGGEFDVTFSFPPVSQSYTISGATMGSGSATSLAGFTFNTGVNFIEWTGTDSCENVAYCSMNVTVVDSAIPLQCPGDQSRTTPFNECSYTASGGEFDVIYSFPPVSQSYTVTGATSGNASVSLDGFTFNKGVNYVEWYGTDSAGDTSSCAFVVVIGSPVLAYCPGDQNRITFHACSYVTLGNEFDATFSFPPASQHYSISGSNSGDGLGTLDGFVFSKGVSLIEWTGTDSCGNVANCSFNVTVVDSVSKVQCTFNQTRNLPPNICSYVTSGSEFDVNFSFGNSALLQYTVSGATSGSGWTTLDGFIFNKGVNSVEWTGIDSCGNTSDCSFSVTVIDVPIAVQCPGALIRNTPNNSCVYLASGSEFDPATSFPAALQSYTVTGATSGSGSGTLDGFSFNKGLNSITWAVTDSCGNTDTCNFDLTIINPPVEVRCPDNQNRILPHNICAYITQGTEFDAYFSFGNSALLHYTISGATSGSAWNTTLDGFAFNPGTSSIEWTGSDSCGNASECSFNVTVVDSPIIALCVADQSRIARNNHCTYITSGSEFDVTFSFPPVSQNYTVSGATSGSGSGTLHGFTFNRGFNHIEWRGTNSCGNADTCFFNLSVIDTPTLLQCPINQNRPTGSNTCSYITAGNEFDVTVSFGNSVSRQYTVTGATSGSGSGTLSGFTFNKGISYVQWAVTDSCGHIPTCSFSITVADNVAPIALCKPNDIVHAPVVSLNDNGSVILTPNDVDNGSMDNCSIFSRTVNPSTLSCTNLGWNNWITLTVADSSGNQASCATLVTVNGGALYKYIILGADVVNLKHSNVNDGWVANTTSTGYSRIESSTLTTGLSPLQTLHPQVISGNVDPIINSVATPPTPAFETNTTTSTLDITIPQGSTVTLGDSVYNKIRLQKFATVIFTSPVVNVRKITAEDYSKIKFIRCTKIRSKETIELLRGTEFNLDGIETTIFSQGDVTIHKGANATATIYAPNNTIKVKSSSRISTTMTGIFSAASVISTEGVTDWFAYKCRKCALSNDLQARFSSVTDISCANANDGSATVEATGGTAPYHYFWSTGDSSTTISGLTDSVYTVTITDALSNTVAANVEIIPFTWSILASNQVNLGKRDTVFSGSVGITTSGGSATIHDNSSIDFENSILQAPSISITTGSSVLVPVYGVAAPLLPTFQGAVTLTSSTDVNVPDNSTLTYTGSLCHNITVGNNSTIVFAAPEVSLTGNLMLKKNTTVKFGQCGKLLIKGSVTADINSNINPDDFSVQLHVNKNVTLNAGATVRAFVYAPNGTIQTQTATAAKPNFMKGTFAGLKVIGNDYTNWHENTTCLCNSSAKTGNEEINDIKGAQDEWLKARVFPNPSTNQFTLDIQSAGKEPIQLNVFDVTGRLIEQKQIVPVQQQILLGSGYSNGLYLFELKQAKSKKMFRVVKGN